MKMNKKMRETALAAMITLALSGSALAMPSGGVVQQGNVSINGAAAGSNIASVADGATIAANSHSIIDWQAFGIEAGQKLHFDTTNGALLNRVVGNNISEILGTLTQQGSNPLLLVNPNGILVGGNAVIDASQLVLSTLALSNDDFNKLANNGIATFATDSKGAGSIMVEKGAKFDIDDVLLMAGGTVNVADGVQFSVGNAKDGMVEITAADKITVDRTKNLQDSMENIASNKDNAVSFHGTIDTNKGTGNTNVHIDGGTVNLDNATIKLNNESEAYLVAGNKAANSATTDNVLSVKNGSVEGGKEVVVAGGKTTIENSSIKTGADKSNVSILAGSSFKRASDGSKAFVTDTATKNNELTIINSTIDHKKGEVQIAGGRTIIDGSTVNSEDTVAVKSYSKDVPKEQAVSGLQEGNITTIKNGSSVKAKEIYAAGYEVEVSSTVKSEGTQKQMLIDKTGLDGKMKVIADSKTTGYAVAPEARQLTAGNNNAVNNNGSFSEADKQNIATGEQAMSDIIKNSKNLADAQASITEQIAKMNAADGSDRAKAGAVLGMLNQLKNDSNLTFAQKQVLQLTVLNAYEPTKNAKAQEEQSKTAAGRAAANTVVDTKAVQATTGANESANDVAVDASAVTE